MFFHAVTNTICPKRKYSFVYNICTLKIQEKLENEKNKACKNSCLPFEKQL